MLNLIATEGNNKKLKKKQEELRIRDYLMKLIINMALLALLVKMVLVLYVLMMMAQEPVLFYLAFKIVI